MAVNTHDYSVFSHSRTPLAVAVQGVLLADGWSPPAPVEVEEDTDTWAGETAAPYHPYSARRHIDSLTSSDVISSFVTIFTDPDEEDLLVIDRVRKLLDHLPVIEADFIDLYFFRHVRQTDIATIFGVSQPTVCYRLQRAIQRIKYLLEIPKLDPVDIRTNLRGFFSDPMDVEVMVLMYETTCQSETAKRLGVTQGFVRHRFMRSTRQLCGHPTMKFYGNVFTAVGENLNLLREVQRSSPAIRSGFVLDS